MATDGLRPQALEDVAWHEAGHAVTRLALGLPVESVQVAEPPWSDDQERGLTCPDVAAASRLRQTDPQAYQRARHVITLAGDAI
jgi:hypothetical protein